MRPRFLENAKAEWPRVYSCKFIEAGIVSYEDSDAGIALLRKETIDNMLPSFIGKPVCIQHQKITPENYLELKQNGVIVGNVIKVWFNPSDGWFWADFIVETEQGRKCIEDENCSVSCAYNVIEVRGGGLWHDIKFDGEISEGSFTHLALVQMPRYEDSKIIEMPAMLVNSKQAKFLAEPKREEKHMQFNWKFWETKENSKDKTVEMLSTRVDISGKTLTIEEVLNAVEKSGILKNEKTMMCAKEDIVDIEGHTYKIGELVDAYNSLKKNDKEEEMKKEEEAKNAKEEEEKAKKEAEEKENSKKVKEAEELANKKKENEELAKVGLEKFNELENAKGSADDSVPTAPLTRAERAQKWAEKNKKK